MHVSSPPTTSRIKSNPIKNCKIQKLTFETSKPGLLIHSISSFISPPELNDVLIARVQPHPPPHTQHTFVPTLEHRHQLSSVVDCFGKFSDINGSVLIFHIHTRVRFCGLNFHFHYCWRWVFPQNRNGVFTILMRWNTNSSVHFPAVNGTWMELTLVFFYLTGSSQLWVTVRFHRVNFFWLIRWSLTVFTFFNIFRTSRKKLFWHTRRM